MYLCHCECAGLLALVMSNFLQICTGDASLPGCTPPTATHCLCHPLHCQEEYFVNKHFCKEKCYRESMKAPSRTVVWTVSHQSLWSKSDEPALNGIHKAACLKACLKQRSSEFSVFWFPTKKWTTTVMNLKFNKLELYYNILKTIESPYHTK